MSDAAFSCKPLTADRWADFESVLGPRGGTGGCWCMWWRVGRTEWTAGKGEVNRSKMHAVVEADCPTGVVGYVGNTPVAWCAVAPRDDYPVLDRSRVLKRVDDEPVWSITCVFVKRSYRRRGLTPALLEGAVEYAAAQGARVVEAYPVDTRGRETVDTFAWTGIATAFERAGFSEVLRRSPTRPIMRKEIAER